jgi:hypothetical protein
MNRNDPSRRSVVILPANSLVSSNLRALAGAMRAKAYEIDSLIINSFATCITPIV